MPAVHRIACTHSFNKYLLSIYSVLTPFNVPGIQGRGVKKIDKVTVLVDSAFNVRRWLTHRQTNKMSSDRDK